MVEAFDKRLAGGLGGYAPRYEEQKGETAAEILCGGLTPVLSQTIKRPVKGL